MATKKTSPALKEYCVWATDILFQHVQATSAEEAYRIAEEDPCFEPCGSCLRLDPDVMDLDTQEYFRVGVSPALPTETAGNFLYVGDEGERIAAFACESDLKLFKRAEQHYDALVAVLNGLLSCCELNTDDMESATERLVEKANALLKRADARHETPAPPANGEDWSQCPTCSAPALEEAEYGPINIEDEGAVQEVTCRKCGADWFEWYSPDNRIVVTNGVIPQADAQPA